MPMKQSEPTALRGRTLRHLHAELWLGAAPYPTRLTNRLRDRATRNNSGARESETETIELMMRETADMDLSAAERAEIAEGWFALVGRLADVADALFGTDDGLTFADALRAASEDDGEEDTLKLDAATDPQNRGSIWYRVAIRQEVSSRRARRTWLREHQRSDPMRRPRRAGAANQNTRSA